ncbi:hypothetical protein K443DRAFT_69646, partial [Laccaria amethystina LaAM-08-1]
RIPRTDHHQKLYKPRPAHHCFFRTYSNRICLQKLTESRIFTNAASSYPLDDHCAHSLYRE